MKSGFSESTSRAINKENLQSGIPQPILDAFQQRKSEYGQRLKEFQQKAESLFTEFFPDEVKSFDWPSVERIFQAFLVCMRPYFSKGNRATREFALQSAEKGFLALGMVRSVDDFIDEALWPHLDAYDHDELKPRFDDFLNRALSLAKEFVPSVPDDIIELPRIELSLETDPSQENFDTNVIRLLERKSFDASYIEEVFTGRKSDRSDIVGWANHVGVCIIDLSRDFAEVNNEEEITDFNIFKHILTHHLDPTILVEYLRNYKTVISGSAFPRGKEIFDTEDVLVICDILIDVLASVNEPVTTKTV